MSRRTPWRLAFAIALGVQLLALYWPRVEITGLPQDSDKVVHLVLFGVPAYLGVVALERRWWWVALALALHAPVSELLQGSLLPWRSATAADAVANLAGVVLGVVLARLTRRSSTHARRGEAPPRRPEDVTIEK